MAVEWKSTSLSHGSSFTRVSVPLLLDEGQLELVTVVSSSSDAPENWRCGIIVCIGSSGHSIFIPETLSLRAGENGPKGSLCCIGDSLALCASIFRSTRSKRQEVDGQASSGSARINGLHLVGDGGGARGMFSL